MIDLTPYEKRLLRLRKAGVSNKEIAKGLGKADQTIRNTFSKIYKKLGTSERYMSHAEIALQNQQLTS